MADEEARLRARIAAVAGAINLRKQQLAADPTAPVQSQQFYNNSAPAHRGGYQQYQHSNRWAPFPASGGRGRGAYGTTFQNRTLVNATAGVTPPPTPPAQAPQQQHRNLQSRPDAMRLAQPPRATVPSRELTIEGVRFTLKEDGSKLTRVPDSSPGTPTPPKAVVAGVQFLRTKNGNLLRAATTNTASKPPNKPIVQCENFIKNGSCPFGIKCRFDHNPNKVSMCKTFFHKGICASGDLCDLSHKPTYNRVPACTHFINGNCTNEACRYAHVSPSTSTFICRPFALLGYCEKGVECDRRHVFECPDFAETGDCANKKCKLNHIRHAHIERQKAGADDDSELEEDEDGMSKDPDSGGLNELAANQDFISFS